LLNTQALFGYFEESVNGVDSIGILSPQQMELKNVNVSFTSVANNVIGTSATSNSTGCEITIGIVITYEITEYYDNNGVLIASTIEQTATMLISIDCTGNTGGGGGGGGCGCPGGGSPGGGTTGGSPTTGGGGSPTGGGGIPTGGGGTSPSGGTNSGGGTSGGTTTGGNPYNPYYNWWTFGTGWPWLGGNTTGGDPWQWWWTGGGGYNPTQTNAEILGTTLGLSLSQIIWLENNPTRTVELTNYLANSTEPEENRIATEHIDAMITDPEYLSFVEQYSNGTEPW
jgi:hypothetical protein